MKRYGTTEEYTKVEPQVIDERDIPKVRKVREEEEKKDETPSEKKPY